MMSTNKYLEEIENTYQIIATDFDQLFARCQDDEKKDELISARNGAKNAIGVATKADLPADSSAIEPSLKSLQDANKKMSQNIQESPNINTVISAMEEAIRLAAVVAAMGLKVE